MKKNKLLLLYLRDMSVVPLTYNLDSDIISHKEPKIVVRNYFECSDDGAGREVDRSVGPSVA